MAINLNSNQDWTYSGNSTTGFNGLASDTANASQTDSIIFDCTGTISYSYSAVLEYSGGVHHDGLDIYEDGVLVDTIGANSPPAETGSRTWNAGSTPKQLKFTMRTDGGLNVANSEATFSNLLQVSEPAVGQGENLAGVNAFTSLGSAPVANDGGTFV